MTTATDFARYVVKVWELKRSANYDRPRVNQPALAITRAAVLADPRKLRLTIPTLATSAITPRSFAPGACGLFQPAIIDYLLQRCR